MNTQISNALSMNQSSNNYTVKKFVKFTDLLDYAYFASYLPKREWIRLNVREKKVLDLGAVGHSFERYSNQPDIWQHKIITDSAYYTIGVDILEKEVKKFCDLGFNMIVGDALSIRLNDKFDVVVCGDLIEHVSNPLALLETIDWHLAENGFALISTPNPFSIARFFNILADGWTPVNEEHVCWTCPQTMFQLVGRTNLEIVDFVWLETDYPTLTRHRRWKKILNFIAPYLARKKQILRNDYGVVLHKKK